MGWRRGTRFTFFLMMRISVPLRSQLSQFQKARQEISIKPHFSFLSWTCELPFQLLSDDALFKPASIPIFQTTSLLFSLRFVADLIGLALQHRIEVNHLLEHLIHSLIHNYFFEVWLGMFPSSCSSDCLWCLFVAFKPQSCRDGLGLRLIFLLFRFITWFG